MLDPQIVAWKKGLRIVEWWAKSWISAACDNTIGRRFFITDSNLMGMCPGSADPGDIICVLLGCSVPVVLRPQGDHYIFLGEAYVQWLYLWKSYGRDAKGKVSA
jgi:hypothetical protein